MNHYKNCKLPLINTVQVWSWFRHSSGAEAHSKLIRLSIVCWPSPIITILRQITTVAKPGCRGKKIPDTPHGQKSKVWSHKILIIGLNSVITCCQIAAFVGFRGRPVSTLTCQPTVTALWISTAGDITRASENTNPQKGTAVTRWNYPV